ncbi:transposase [Lactiplantibacillus plantarum]
MDEEHCGIQLTLAGYGNPNANRIYFRRSRNKGGDHTRDCVMKHGSDDEKDAFLKGIFEKLNQNVPNKEEVIRSSMAALKNIEIIENPKQSEKKKDIEDFFNKDTIYHLTSIMDLYSRRIIGWDLSETLEVSNVISLIEKTKHSRHISKPLIMHSDRGSQFTSEAYNQVTANMTLSYSKKAYPWDNACIESFHALIKREWINRFKIHSYSEAKRLVFQYIETFYNTVRIHSHCGFKSPKQLEDEYQTQIQNLVVA